MHENEDSTTNPESTTSRIQHATNQGEYHIPHSRYTVDGYDADTNTVYEFPT